MTLQVDQNPRGIPKAPFIDSIEAFCPPGEQEATLVKFQEMISYFSTQKPHFLNLQEKIPEIRKSLEMCLFLKDNNQQSQEAVETQFELAETLWAHARVSGTLEKVNLWLGANVMLEYPLDEAVNLLTTKLKAAKESQIQVSEDLDFLKEQITTMEVNMARVYNYDVKLRRMEKK